MPRTTLPAPSLSLKLTRHKRAPLTSHMDFRGCRQIVLTATFGHHPSQEVVAISLKLIGTAPLN